jgi:hypothetical protein
MPKKFGTNSKSEEARERKNDLKKQKQDLDRKQKEDKLWEDNDKQLKAKEDRKRELEEKKQKEKDRKDENKRLAEEESSLYSKKTKSEAPTKKTRAQIESARLAAIASMQAQVKKEAEDKEAEILANIDKDINPNHALRDEEARLAQTGAELLVASGIDQVVDLAEEEKSFKHPEKKVKQAWNLFVEENLPKARKDYPSLKRSQLLQILHKEFEKAAENPFNQNFLSFNSKVE